MQQLRPWKVLKGSISLNFFEEIYLLICTLDLFIAQTKFVEIDKMVQLTKKFVWIYAKSFEIDP